MLFRQRRIGKDGQPFDVLKFRTMVAGADRIGDERIAGVDGVNMSVADAVTALKPHDDPRVTRFGRVLRASSLDELPQLVNVLKGDMSLVGPRPLRDFEVDSLAGWERDRLTVRPGMTGPLAGQWTLGRRVGGAGRDGLPLRPPLVAGRGHADPVRHRPRPAGPARRAMTTPVALITGSGGLIGSESARYFATQGFDVVGIDNDMRAYFFGDESSTKPTTARLAEELGDAFRASTSTSAISRRSTACSRSTARGSSWSSTRQRSHPTTGPPASHSTDFDVNAVGTLNVLQAARDHAPSATFIFTSTNKVYGDRPNDLPLVELETRWELPEDHEWFAGIPVGMSIDRSTHSVFGASKVAADVMVQEYGRYFGMPTVCFRGGCLTGPQHAGAQLHGFLAYLMRCTVIGHALHDPRLQGQAGPRQHPRARRRPRLRRLPREPDARRPSTTSAAAESRMSRCARRSSSASGSRAAPWTTR